MPDLKRAVFVSDLHLGSNAALDDFRRDDELAVLLGLSELQPPPGEEVDLVLLGDTFDLWQSVDDEECRQRRSVDIDFGITASREAQRLDGIRPRHERWFEALGAFGRRERCRLVFVTGNHDHTLLLRPVQDRLVQLLDLGSRKPTFASFYESPALRLYADHGNQYDYNNQYEAFDQVETDAECRGYYFVKLFFNRIEALDPSIENGPGGWGNVWHYLRRAFNFRLLAAAIRYFAQYWTDGRVPRKVSPLREAGAEPEPFRVESPSEPLLLLGEPEARSPEAFFSEDPEMEHFFRVAYERSPEVRLAVNEILVRQDARPAPALERSALVRTRRRPARRTPRRKATDRRRPGVPRPGQRPAPAAAGTRGLLGGAEDVEWAEALFQDRPAFRERLTREAFDFVLFGHTHGPKTQRLSNGATYLNTGTWNNELPEPTLVLAEGRPGQAPAAALKKLVGGKLV